MSHGGRAALRWLVVMLSLTLFALVVPPAHAGGNSKTPVWLGGPFKGLYGGADGIPDTRPGKHAPYSGQWAADLYAKKGTSVYAYAAPKDSALDRKITAKVMTVAASSCGAAKGGYTVKVGYYHSGTLVGWVSYTHLSAVKVKQGQALNRWGAKLGEVGWFKYSNCWQVKSASGAHVHFEARNASGTSCYRAVSKGQKFSRSEFMGYIGRNDKGACDAGA